jgi:sec-independent protein translocase protein TatB
MGTPLPVELDILGWSDSLILMVLALVVFGPRRLPQIGRQIGKLMYEFRKASNEFKFQMEEELRSAEEADRRKKEEERLKALALKAPATDVPATPVAETAAAPNLEEPAGLSKALPAESQPVVSSATPAEPAEPRILPPSTGETVAASRPAASASSFEFHDEADSGTNGSGGGPERDRDATPESAVQETVPASPETEQAAHHG